MSKGLPAALVLAALAFLPFLGVVMLSVREISQANAAQAEIVELEVAVADAILISELASSLFDERNWSVAVLGVSELGVPLELAAEFVVIDRSLFEQLADSQAETDRLLALVEAAGLLNDEVSDEFQVALAVVRDGGQVPFALLNLFENLQFLLLDGGRDAFGRVEVHAGNLENAAALTRSAQIVHAADHARVLVAEQQASYFGTQVELGQDPRDAYADLVSHVAAYDVQMDLLRTLPHPDSSAYAVVREVEASPAVVDFLAAIDLHINLTLDAGIVEPEMGLSQLIQLAGALAANLGAAVVSAEEHGRLLYAAEQDLRTETRALQQALKRTTQVSIAIGALFLVVAIGSVLAGIRTIVRPLNRLADSAVALTSGTARGPANVGGPVEVRAAAQAIDQAGLNLRLAENQAQALSSGRLDDPCLDTQVEGDLGASLQDAVQTLTSSIKQGEAFRSQLAFEASHDGLTSISNRADSLVVLAAALDAAHSVGDDVAVLFIDLDRFKQINDRLGHRAGDHVLRIVAERLEEEIREVDHAGRLGGDEFIVVLNPANDVEEVVLMAERLVARICEPMLYGKAKLSVGASIGIAFSSAYPVAVADQLMSDADLAVYQAKGLGSGRVEVCSDALRNRVHREEELTRALRTAIDEGQLDVYYQAVVAPETGDVRSLEALVRWNRPGHGVLSAESFIDFAERSGLVVEIDRTVLNLVLNQIEAWAEDPVLGHLPVSVNISGRNLGSDDFVSSILSTVESFDVDPSLVILEVKENALFENVDVHATRLQVLRDAGLLVAVDNFGTGYTSLARLRYLPIDILKIDSSFVANVTTSAEDRSLIQMIVDAGHILGATILAEGVETTAQAQYMRELGSDELQGYLFSHPKPASELAKAVLDEVPTSGL